MDNFMYYWVPLLAVILIGLITVQATELGGNSDPN
jgi:hypothetical protein